MDAPGENDDSRQEEVGGSDIPVRVVETGPRADPESEIPARESDLPPESSLAPAPYSAFPPPWYSPYGRYESIEGLVSALAAHDHPQQSVLAHEVQQIQRRRAQNQIIRDIQEDLEAQADDFRKLEEIAAKASAEAREVKREALRDAECKVERQAKREDDHEDERKMKREDDGKDERKIKREDDGKDIHKAKQEDKRKAMHQPHDVDGRGTLPDGRPVEPIPLASHSCDLTFPAVEFRRHSLAETDARFGGSCGLSAWVPPNQTRRAPEDYPYGLPPNLAPPVQRLPPSETAVAPRGSAHGEHSPPEPHQASDQHRKRRRRANELRAAQQGGSRRSGATLELSGMSTTRRSLPQQRRLEPRHADLAVALAVRQDAGLDELREVTAGFRKDYDSTHHDEQAAMVHDFTIYVQNWAQQLQPMTRIQRRTFAPFSGLSAGQRNEDVVIESAIRPFISSAHDASLDNAAADLDWVKDEGGSDHRVVKDEGES